MNYRIRTALLLAALGSLTGCGGGSGSAFRDAELQAVLDRAVAAGVPGIVMGIEDEHGIWLGSAGIADPATGEALGPDARIRLASITKPFTAIVVMKLVEEGKLSLNDTLEQWVPGAVSDAGQITIGMMLNHTAGVPDHEDASFIAEVIADPTREWSEAEIEAIVRSRPPDFIPGSQWRYSNAGYYLLGMVIERVSGRSVEDLAREMIFERASMLRSSLTRNSILTAPHAHGYTLASEGGLADTTNWNISWDWTAGAGISTARDMLAFAKAFYNGKIVSPDTVSAMIKPVAPSTTYGYGIEIAASPTRGVYIGHSGNNPGTTTAWYYLPDRKCVIFVGLNRSDVEDVPGSINSGTILSQALVDALDLIAPGEKAQQL